MSFHDVVAAALVHPDEVLLCHRSPTRSWYPDVWDFPGGHVEDGETAHVALRRELTEELGIDIGLISGPPAFRLGDDSEDLSLRVWVVSSWLGEVQNLEPEEHDDLGWFTREQLGGVSLADHEYRPFLRRLLLSNRV